ncbi:MAG TPA: 3-oxoacyl-[acyl-carrier-protein] synthase III C-terminal domain-containing protein, partial [Thermoanaerobaculia bacterium]|nr:3-oxoacyl-[acyl-carrier-protein] synthase III C-terminal domain-containing protein [Thermoanaerobaculia bacterium]
MKNLTPPPKNRTTVIRGSGMYVPPQVVTNAMMSRIMDTSDEWIVPRTGIRERRFTAPGVGSAEIGAEAARAALADAGLAAEEIDLIVFATMTPDHYFPGNGGLLADRLGLKTTHALDIRMQCAGFLSGLQTADAFIRSGMYDRILLVGAEVHSGLMPWPPSVWDVMLGVTPGPCDPAWYAKATSLRDRAVLFGDGAGAFVLEANESGDGRGLLSFAMYTDGAHWDKLHVPGVGCKYRPYVSHEMVEKLEAVPIVEGRQVFRLAANLMPAAVLEVLKAHGKTLEDLDLLLMHQANLRINEAAQKVLGLPDAKVFNNIEKYGNTTAATLPMAFHEARLAGRIRPGSLVGFTALGAGLHWGA